MDAVTNVKFKMDGAVLVEVQHQKVSVPNLFQPEVSSFPKELFKEVEKSCKESRCHTYLMH